MNLLGFTVVTFFWRGDLRCKWGISFECRMVCCCFFLVQEIDGFA